MLQKVFGESTPAETRAFEWYSEFKSWRDVKDLPRSDQPSTAETESSKVTKAAPKKIAKAASPSKKVSAPKGKKVAKK